MSVTLLCTGDLHLGRSSARVPSELGSAVTSAAGAWRRIVQTAIERRVDAVCLTGDVADAANRFWEAIGPLEQGIGQLHEAGIVTLAVAGNHDHAVLPRLADQLPEEAFILLGRGGQWQRYTFECDGEPPVAIDGWSFPQSHVPQSPLASYRPHELDAAGEAPFTLAMVHGDLNAPDSAYAPLDRAAMAPLPVAGWLLGHIHVPQCEHVSGSPLVLYPGSPQALDPGEEGAHGPWMIELAPAKGSIERAEQVPISGVRYASLSIDVSEVEDEGGFESHVLGALDRFGQAVTAESGPALGWVSVRVTLTGQTPLAGRLPQLVANLGEVARTIEQAQLGVERVTIEAGPAADLDAWAASDRAPGTVARLLHALDEDDPPAEVRQLIAHARQKLEQIQNRRDYLPLRDHHDDTNNAASDTVDDAAARQYLRREAQHLMRELLSQQA
jgi:predicted phosphodiesterase